MELKRRGYQVYIGKLGTQEIDFIAQKQTEKRYIPVACKLESEQTVQLAFSLQQTITDGHPNIGE